MKTSNYLAKLPQEATIKSIQVLKDYDLITLDVPTASQRLCPHCGSNDCVIKDSGTLQTIRHIPCNHRGTVVSFHKRRLLCKDCHSSFYETPYWIHPSLRMTQALYDSILLDLIQPLAFSEVARRNHVPQSTVQSVFQTVHFGRPAKLPETICIDEFKGNSGVWSSKHRRWYRNKYHCTLSDGDLPFRYRCNGSDLRRLSEQVFPSVLFRAEEAGEILLLRHEQRLCLCLQGRTFQTPGSALIPSTLSSVLMKWWTM